MLLSKLARGVIPEHDLRDLDGLSMALPTSPKEGIDCISWRVFPGIGPGFT